MHPKPDRMWLHCRTQALVPWIAWIQTTPELRIEFRLCIKSPNLLGKASYLSPNATAILWGIGIPDGISLLNWVCLFFISLVRDPSGGLLKADPVRLISKHAEYFCFLSWIFCTHEWYWTIHMYTLVSKFLYAVLKSSYVPAFQNFAMTLNQYTGTDSCN